MNKNAIDRYWTHIYWLTVLAEQGSFTSAARRLSVSKSSMSQKMAELESAAGVPLILRTTRSVRLTDAGLQLVDDTRNSFKEIEEGFSQIQDLSTVPAGLLRITAPVAFARQQLVARLPEFLQHYPRIRIELDMSDSLASLTTDGFDLALRHIQVPPDTYVARLLCKTRTLLLASPDYLARQGTPKHPADLVNHRQLHYPRQMGVANWVFRPKSLNPINDKDVTIPVRPRFVVNNSEVLRDMACAGMGIALIPDFSAQLAVQEGKLVEILKNWESINTFGQNVYALRPYSSNIPRNVRVLLDYLIDTFASGF